MLEMGEPLEIRPLVGVGDLLLGSSRGEVLGLLGEPDDKRAEDYAGTEDDPDELWVYGAGIELAFSPDDDYLLGSIDVSAKDATLAGTRLIGLDEAGFLAAVRAAGIEDVRFDAEYEFVDLRVFVCDRLNLMVWLSGGIVTSITIMPEHDASGNEPIWPERGSS